MKTKIITKSFFNGLSLNILTLFTGVNAGLYYFKIVPIAWAVGFLILSILLSGSVQIADQWEKAVVLRLGKFRGLRGQRRIREQSGCFATAGDEPDRGRT